MDIKDLIPLDANYLLQKKQKKFNGMGNDIFVEGYPALMPLLSESGRQNYFEGLVVNMAFSKPVADNFDKSAFGLPLMGAGIYSHMFAGLGK